jgi:hypothetical protein
MNPGIYKITITGVNELTATFEVVSPGTIIATPTPVPESESVSIIGIKGSKSTNLYDYDKGAYIDGIDWAVDLTVPQGHKYNIAIMQSTNTSLSFDELQWTETDSAASHIYAKFAVTTPGDYYLYVKILDLATNNVTTLRSNPIQVGSTVSQPGNAILEIKWMINDSVLVNGKSVRAILWNVPLELGYYYTYGTFQSTDPADSFDNITLTGTPVSFSKATGNEKITRTEAAEEDGIYYLYVKVRKRDNPDDTYVLRSDPVVVGTPTTTRRE